jgi:DNA-binding transcriptional regulator YdaS (Cro superfamily)
MHEKTRQCADRVGGVGKLAALLGIKGPSLYSWRRIPAERVLQLERITGIPKEELRPDLFKSEAAA